MIKYEIIEDLFICVIFAKDVSGNDWTAGLGDGNTIPTVYR